jgi:probable phosphoglycerate mutase
MPPPVVYYVRHGQTEWNAARRLQGQRDIPLNDIGRAQAVHCGKILADLFARDGRSPSDLDYISSPLLRASETMELLRTTLGLERDGYRVEERLQEMSFGRWEGLTFSELQTRESELLATREHDKWRFTPPGGENYEHVIGRVRAWHAGLTRDTVVTAHGETARVLLVHLGLSQPDALLRRVEHGVVYVLKPGGIERYAN